MAAAVIFGLALVRCITYLLSYGTQQQPMPLSLHVQDPVQRKRSSEGGAGSWPFDAKPSSPPLQRVPLPAPHAAAAEQQRARRQQQPGLALHPAALTPTASEPSPKPFGSLLSEAQLERISAESAALQGGADLADARSAAAVHAEATAHAFPYAPLPSPPLPPQQQHDEETVQVRVCIGMTSVWLICANIHTSCGSFVSGASAGSLLARSM